MKLPKFIYNASVSRNTSIGKNEALPDMADVPYEYRLLKKRQSSVLDSMQREFGTVDMPVDEAETMLSRLIIQTMEEERPVREQLEKLCEAIVENSLAVPPETVILECRIVDKVEPENALRIMPEEDDDDEPEYTFDDVEQSMLMGKTILMRRFVDALVQGAAYTLMKEYLDNDTINEWSEKLLPLYNKVISLNDYLLFTKKESITDKNPMLGAYVGTHLGKEDEKTVISSQGLIYPLLLQETFRGFFEMFASHGLPDDVHDAMYVIRRADFTIAEAWDLRIGVPLFQQIMSCLGNRKETALYPYIFSSIVQQESVDEFNMLMKNILLHTRTGRDYLEYIVDSARHDSEYNMFKRDVERFNLEKVVISDETQIQ